jgi:hypothetical protein
MTQALTSRRRWLALPTVLIATFMAQFDLFVVNVALPVLQRELNASDARAPAHHRRIRLRLRRRPDHGRAAG